MKRVGHLYKSNSVFSVDKCILPGTVVLVMGVKDGLIEVYFNKKLYHFVDAKTNFKKF